MDLNSHLNQLWVQELRTTCLSNFFPILELIFFEKTSVGGAQRARLVRYPLSDPEGRKRIPEADLAKIEQDLSRKKLRSQMARAVCYPLIRS